MALLVTDGCQATVTQTIDGQPIDNVINMAITTTYTHGQIAVMVANAWTTTQSFHTYQMAAVVYESITVRYLNGEDGTVVPWPIPTANGAIGSGRPAAVNAAAVYTLHTGQPGRSGRGRLYIAGYTDNALTANATQWDVGFSSGAMAAAADNFQAELETNANVSLAVLSRKNAAVYDVTETTFNSRIGTQRMRASRYGA